MTAQTIMESPNNHIQLIFEIGKAKLIEAICDDELTGKINLVVDAPFGTATKTADEAGAEFSEDTATGEGATGTDSSLV